MTNSCQYASPWRAPRNMLPLTHSARAASRRIVHHISYGDRLPTGRSRDVVHAWAFGSATGPNGERLGWNSFAAKTMSALLHLAFCGALLTTSVVTSVAIALIYYGVLVM